MKIDLETRHDEWRTVDVADAPLPDAAYAALLATYTFLTPDNHRRRPHDSPANAYCGTVRVERAYDIALPVDPQLRRMVMRFGATTAGDLWLCDHWRSYHPHRALAVDGSGRRWTMVRLESGYAKWECLSDLTERPLAVPGPWQPSCCGKPLVDGVCFRCGPAWRITAEQSTELELHMLDAVRLDRHLLTLCTELVAGRTTPAKARDRFGHCGRGRVGLEVFRRKVVGLSQRIERAQLGEPLWVDENWALIDADPRTLMQAATDIVAVLDTARTADVVVEGAA